MPKSTWTTKDLLQLYKLRNKQKKTWAEIGIVMSKTAGAVSRKYIRIDWKAFIKNPDAYVGHIKELANRVWTNIEMVKLEAYLQADKSYRFIAKKLNRNPIAIERKAQTTDWKAWRAIDPNDRQKEIEKATDEEKEIFLKQLVDALLSICRHNFDKLRLIEEKEFLHRVNLERDRLYLSFAALKKKAIEELNILGFGNEENLELGEGTYVIVGDSHGKHTKKSMFALIKEINKYLKPKNIIHVGHILDDDNDISYEWGKFNNLIVLAKIEELRTVQDQRNKFSFNYDVIRETITLGKDLVLFNQDMISDYVKTPIKNLDVQIFDEKVIINCHRHEFISRCSNEGASYFASPGCLCESHIIRTIKQIDFTDGKVVKQAFWDGFSKYRRMKHTNKYWEQGLLIVNVDKDGFHTIVPCNIQKTSKGFTTAYFNKMISSKGIFDPEKRIFINGDLHCDKHDIKILDIQESICKDYKPDTYVNVGDTLNYSSLNHHVMDRGGVINKRLMDEAAQTYFILKRTSKWAKDCRLIYGNHERFATDFIEKYPQLKDYLDFKFICDIESLGYKLTPLKSVLNIGSAKFIHGEIRMYGQTGSKLEKASRTFGKNVFMGHIHNPSIRFGCYSVGLTGELNQDYNEAEASQWIHGFGLCNQYKGKSWMTTVAIVQNKCFLNNKKYIPVKPESWNVSKYNVKLQYTVS